MKNEKNGLLTFTKALTIILFFLIILIAVFLPNVLVFYIRLAGRSFELYSKLIIVLYIAFIPAEVATVILYKLLSNIGKSKIFDKSNCTLLFILSCCCFSVCLLFAAFTFFYISTMLVSFAAGFIGLILLVIRAVFVKAIEIKEENEYTI